MSDIKPVENLHGLSPIEDWIQHSQWLEQERDKYRDAVKRLIGHYGAAHLWYASGTHGNRVDFYIGVSDSHGYDFARQIKAELEGIEGSEIEVDVE